MHNYCQFIGNLTRDVEAKDVGNSKVYNVGLALTKQYKNRSGQTEKKTVYVDVKFWDAKGEAFAKFHKKGQPAFVECEYEPEVYDEKDKETKEATGKKITRAVFRGLNWKFLPFNEKKTKGSEDNAVNSDVDTNDNSSGDVDNDIPF